MLDDLYKKIISILNENTEKCISINDVEINLADMGIGSIRIVKVINDLEEAFCIEFDDDDLKPESFESINSIKECISRYVK